MSNSNFDINIYFKTFDNDECVEITLTKVC